MLQSVPGSKTTFLRFSHTTSNVGKGPLEIYPDLEAEDCNDRGDRALVAYQRIYQDTNGSGNFQRGVDIDSTEQTVGCMIFHDIHNHYHFEDFAQYELYRVKSGVLKETSDKVSFCVVDILNTHPGLRRRPGSLLPVRGLPHRTRGSTASPSAGRTSTGRAPPGRSSTLTDRQEPGPFLPGCQNRPGRSPR